MSRFKLCLCAYRYWLLVLVFLCVSGCAVKNDSSDRASIEGKPVFTIYLAGPEVFLPNPIAAGEEKKQLIKRLSEERNWPFKLAGLYPMDNEIPNFKPDRVTGIVIYEANIKLMQEADYVAANMVRFRGPSMDVGTAFEMGFMRGLNKPVFAYYESYPFYQTDEKPGLYAERVKAFYQVSADNPEKDVHGQTVENFEMSDNLMMIGALNDSATEIKMTFEEVVEAIAQDIISRYY